MGEVIHNFNLSRQQRKAKPGRAQYYELAVKCRSFKIFTIKPLCYTSSRFGHYLSWGIFHEDTRVDNFEKAGMGAAECYHWIYKHGDEYLDNIEAENILLGLGEK